MLDLTLGQFVVALCMSLAGVCIFVWAVLSGQLRDVEEIARRAYRTEVPDDEHK